MPSTTNKSPFSEISQTYGLLLQRVTAGELEVATLAGGCFWCMEGPFEANEGVVEVVSGFAGGEVANPTYRQVVSGTTGHREGVQIFYDPTKISFNKILEIYWFQIDPTDSDGQFSDRGFIYTTAIFYHSLEQKQVAETQISELTNSNRYQKPIATQVLEFSNFFPAEDYHQNFYQKSSEYYRQYKKGSGREDYIKAMEAKYQ